MPIEYQNSNYVWALGSSRPLQPPVFSEALFQKFIETPYAQKTPLATFLNAHPNAMTDGVLNQLHRRNIISWDLIKAFTEVAAGFDFASIQEKEPYDKVFNFFNITSQNAIQLPHGKFRAAAWTTIANQMCWTDNNILVVPSAGNAEVATDQEEELSKAERGQLFKDIAWEDANFVNSFMEEFVNR